MKRFSLVTLIFTFLLAGCSRNIENTPCNDSRMVLHGIVDGASQTRTSMGNFNSAQQYYETLWTDGDAIAILVEESQNAAKFTLEKGAGTQYGTFGGYMPNNTSGKSMVALYPASSAKGLSNGILSLTLPAEQDYAAGAFGNNTFPMMAVSDSNDLEFKNLCGVLRVSVKGNGNISSIIVKANDPNCKLSGDATVKVSSKDNPVLSMTSSGSNEVMLNCSLAPINTTTATDFYIVVPAQEYKGGLNITVKTSSGSAQKSITSDVTITRSIITPVREISVENQFSGDASILMDLYYATDGDHWYNNTNWGSDKPLNQWEGIGCNQNGRVESIILYCNNVSGHLPSSIGELTELQSLFIGNEGYYYVGGCLSGNIPESIGNLAQLRTINLRYNQLSGHLPKQLSRLAKLEELHIDGNNIIGTTDELNELLKGFTRLLELDISENFFEGEFPLSIMNLDNLIGLNLSGNCFYGTLPSEISRLNKLERLGLSDNEFSGIIPPEIGMLNNLTHLSIDLNNISGNIPASIGNLTKLESLSLFGNNLSGSIPSEIGNCTKLQSIQLPYNQLTGEIPKEIGNLTNLTFLSLFKNNLTGSIPAEIGNLKNLATFYLANNQISGSIPPELGNLTKMDQLNITYNHISGSIPKELGNMTNLRDLSIKNNELTGQIPAELANLKNASWISLDHNKLTGQIPAEFASCPKLEMLSCSYNYLDTNIPDALKQHKYYSNWELTPQYERSSDLYESTDFNYDGTVKQLQKHTVGNGIKIVITGDAFADKDYVGQDGAESLFDQRANLTMTEFFKEEPYKTFRDRFDVYSVAAVSRNDIIADEANTTFGCYYGDGTHVGGADSKVFKYAQKAVDASEINGTTIIVMVNDIRYAGTTWTYDGGASIAYVSYCYGNATDYGNTMRHEAGGHGFSKLMDEYFYEEYGIITTKAIEDLKQQHNMGWAKNVDVTNDPDKIIWARFLASSLYKNQVGIYEGANLYPIGAYRPTDYSIMRYNVGGFNAPSRESIYRRIMELSGETYSWDGFVEYDAVNRVSYSGAYQPKSVQRKYEPLAAPVMTGHSWRESNK